MVANKSTALEIKIAPIDHRTFKDDVQKERNPEMGHDKPGKVVF